MPNIVLKQHRGSIPKVMAFVEDMAVQSAYVDDYRGWPWAGRGYTWVPKAWTLYVDGRPVAVGCVQQERTYWGTGTDPLGHAPMYRAYFCRMTEYARWPDGFTRRRLEWKASDLFDWPAEGDKWLKATLTQLAEETA